MTLWLQRKALDTDDLLRSTNLSVVLLHPPGHTLHWSHGLFHIDWTLPSRPPRRVWLSLGVLLQDISIQTLVNVFVDQTLIVHENSLTYRTPHLLNAHISQLQRWELENCLTLLANFKDKFTHIQMKSRYLGSSTFLPWGPAHWPPPQLGLCRIPLSFPFLCLYIFFFSYLAYFLLFFCAFFFLLSALLLLANCHSIKYSYICCPTTSYYKMGWFRTSSVFPVPNEPSAADVFTLTGGSVTDVDGRGRHSACRVLSADVRSLSTISGFVCNIRNRKKAFSTSPWEHYVVELVTCRWVSEYQIFREILQECLLRSLLTFFDCRNSAMDLLFVLFCSSPANINLDRRTSNT